MSDPITAAAEPASPDRAASPPTSSPAPAEDWRDTLPDDLKPMATAKGWRSPAEALKSYVHLERLVGADKIALPAKDAHGNRDWSKWEGWAAIGRPEAADRLIGMLDAQAWRAARPSHAGGVTRRDRITVVARQENM